MSEAQPARRQWSQPATGGRVPPKAEATRPRRKPPAEEDIDPLEAGSARRRRNRAVAADLGLWFAVFAGPAAWSLHSLLSTGLVPVACAVGAWPLDLVTLGMAALAIAGVVAGARRYAVERAAGRHFAAGASILLDVFFAAVVVFEGVPSLVVNPCWS